MTPIIAQVWRGARVESRHRGSYAVVDAEGRRLESAGDVDTPEFARSALKLLQALPLVESGAADAYGFGDAALALACASHSSEPGHVAGVAEMLAAAGFSEEDLGCGAHWPLFQIEAAAEMAARGERPSRLHNNCSGKHAGFLCLARHQGASTADYLAQTHPTQREIRAVLEALVGAPAAASMRARDGCSAPTYAFGLAALAGAFARLFAGRGVGASRAAAGRRLLSACLAEPWRVAGAGRVCTQIMTIGAGRIFAKVGAEGVYVAYLPREGLAIALKCEDGATRAAEVLAAALCARLLQDPSDALARGLVALSRRPIRDWNGAEVGRLEAVAP